MYLVYIHTELKIYVKAALVLTGGFENTYETGTDLSSHVASFIQRRLALWKSVNTSRSTVTLSEYDGG